MRDVLGTAATAAGVFAGTNVDDLLVLTVLFLGARAAGRPAPGRIWVGQYAGIGVLVAVSAVAALGLIVVPDRWVGLLGLVPFALGLKGLIATIRSGTGEARTPPVAASGVLTVAGITVANGADNVAVYTPLFRTIGLAGSSVTMAVFAVSVAAWCTAAWWLGGHRKAVAATERFGHWVVPVTFMVIGAVIVAESGVLHG